VVDALAERVERGLVGNRVEQTRERRLGLETKPWLTHRTSYARPQAADATVERRRRRETK